MFDFVIHHPALCVLAIMLGFAALEWLRGTLTSPSESREDAPLEASITLLFGALIVPGILTLTATLGRHWAPSLEGVLAALPAWQMVLLLLVFDDCTQYWWHRASHTPILWPLHRAHHSAPYMSVRVVYRNNFFYYALMPGIWLSSVLVFLGLGAIYPFYLIFKLLVICGAHSETRWDAFLYRHRLLHPLAWIVERTISTPATHFAHHAMVQDDGIGHYRGNYGNLLFVWDLLFGTGKITRRYPPRVGLKDDVDHGPERWWVQLLYPLVKSSREASALGHEATIIG